jgi:Flp pilus assembly protein TadG
MLNRLSNLVRLRGFARDSRGVSAVEFALVAPILVMAYLGLAELTLGMMASRRASHLAATIGDLAAQSETLTDANITDLWAIATSMMDPFPTGTALKMRVSDVKMVSGKATVQWCEPQNWTDYTDKVTVINSISLDQLPEGQTLIMTEVEYNYVSPIGLITGTSHSFLPNADFKDTFFHHPRNGAEVKRSAT